jgi:predicted outer membrane repeat protein
MQQGNNRLERGIIYYNYLAHYYAGRTYLTQELGIIPGVGHDAGDMFQSDCGLYALFDYGTCNYKSSVIEPGGPLTIQDAIDLNAQQDYYTLVLKPGTYSGYGNRDITFGGRAMTLRSMDGNPATCIIDCNSLGRGFDFNNSEPPEAVLLGVTIKNGGDVTYGGGINFESSSPTIRDCILLENSALAGGGGMNIDGASPTITSTTIQGNSAPQGGGVYCTGSTPSFFNTIISFSTLGEAFWMDGTSSPAIGDCDFYGNAGLNWTGLVAGYLGINGNIEQDPLYCDASIDDLTLCADSPCLPAFNPSGEHLGAEGEGCVECRPPTVTTHPQSQAICVGDPVTFTVVADGAAPLSYQWRKNSVSIVGATSDSYTIPSVAAADAANYDVVVTNNSGTDTSNPATLTVNEPVAITAHPQSQTKCVDDPVTFTVTATGTGPLSYQWRKNGGDISGATSNSYSIPSVTTDHGGSYDVVVTNVCGALTSNSATLTVGDGPVFTQHPQSVSACEDDAVVFYVVAGGEPPLTYQWRKDTAIIPGATNDSLVIDQVTTDDAGVYDVDVTDLCGFALSNAGTLTVDTGPAITAHPQSRLICEDDPVTFTVTASGRPPLGYQWRKNSVDISGATSSSYTISSVTSGDGGSYDVVVTDDCGSTTSNAATLTVGFVPIVFSVNPSWSLEDPCEGDTISVDVVASGVPGPTYQWRKNGVPLVNGSRVSGATTNRLEIKPAGQIDLGSYDVVLTNMCGSATSYTVALLTVLPMTVNVPGDYSTIQDAVDAVCPYGGVVILTDTLYQGAGNTDVDYGGGAITVRSASGDPESCVIDCQSGARGFIFQSGEGSGSVLEGVTVKFGSASSGGAIYCSGAGPTINNCIFLSNSATSDGGAIYCEFQGVVLTGCIFESNSAGSNGGAVACITSSPSIIGCTFRDNTAQTGGGVYAAQNSEPSITNCTFYDNDAWNGSGLGLRMASYANIEKTIISFGRTTNPAPTGCVYCTDSSGPSMWCCDVYGNADGDWIGCIAGSAPPASSNFWADPLFCDTLSIGYDLELHSTSPCLPANTPCLQLVGAHGHGCGGCVVTDSVIFVDGTATGAANGLSWTDAFTGLQDALAMANECTTSVEIWVAAGTYYPSDTDDRDARFELVNNTGIYGGFAGTETQRSERDWRANVTVLSGDIGVDEDNSDNSYHVTWASGTDSTAIIDGFTITRGHANGTVGFPDGAGMFIGGAGSPTVTNIIFRDNVCTYYGAAMFNYDGSSPRVTNCMFFNNSTIRDGGAIQNRNNCNPVFVNVTFSGNVAEHGGAMHNQNNSNPIIINAVMWGDSATAGVAEIENVSSTPTISYSLVQGSGGSGAWNSSYGTDGGDNIDDDPLFADQSSGNLRLTGGSPAIDAGDTSALGWPERDLDANPRIIGDVIDMGAYEFQGAFIAAHPSPLVFSQVPGHDTTCDTLYVVNDGDTTCTIEGIQGCDVPPFSMDTTMTEHVLEPGDTTEIVVCVTPTTQGPDTSTVTVVSDAWNSPTTVSVQFVAATAVRPQYAPEAFRIVSVSPNPFNPSTTVRFTLPAAMAVTAEVWTVKGARVRLLVSDEKFGPGDNRVVWDGRTDQGTVVASGVYFVRVRTQLGTRVARAVLMK